MPSLLVLTSSFIPRFSNSLRFRSKMGLMASIWTLPIPYPPHHRTYLVCPFLGWHIHRCSSFHAWSFLMTQNRSHSTPWLSYHYQYVKERVVSSWIRINLLVLNHFIIGLLWRNVLLYTSLFLISFYTIWIDKLIDNNRDVEPGSCCIDAGQQIIIETVRAVDLNRLVFWCVVCHLKWNLIHKIYGSVLLSVKYSDCTAEVAIRKCDPHASEW